MKEMKKRGIVMNYIVRLILILLIIGAIAFALLYALRNILK